MVRVMDLPEVTGQRLPNGAYIEPVRPVLRCPSCGQTFSATPGDYWMLPGDHVLTCDACDGEPMTLVRKRVVYENWE